MSLRFWSPNAREEEVGNPSQTPAGIKLISVARTFPDPPPTFSSDSVADSVIQHHVASLVQTNMAIMPD